MKLEKNRCSSPMARFPLSVVTSLDTTNPTNPKYRTRKRKTLPKQRNSAKIDLHNSTVKCPICFVVELLVMNHPFLAKFKCLIVKFTNFVSV